MSRGFSTALPFLLMPFIILGCASSQPVIDSNGLILRDSSIQFIQFKASFDRANAFALQVIGNQIDRKDPKIQSTYSDMFDAGSHLADANCADYFRTAGKDQKWLLLSKDLVAAAGTLATAVSAATGASTAVTVGFSIATATAYNGLDIYQRNFLFGADNIQSVQLLVQRAQSTHTQKTMELATKNGWTGFGEVVNSIMDHQAICSPAYILMLTRSAIRYGNVYAETGEGKRVDVNVVPTSQLAQYAQDRSRSAVAPGSPGLMVPNGRMVRGEGLPILRPPPGNVVAKVNALLRYLRALASGREGLANMQKIARELDIPDQEGTQSLPVGELRDRVVARTRAAIDSNDPDTAAGQYETFLNKIKKAGFEPPK